MSYLTRAQILRSIAAPSISVRAFSVATQRQKSAVDAAKDAVNKVNHKVADVLVDGIEIGGTWFDILFYKPFLFPSSSTVLSIYSPPSTSLYSLLQEFGEDLLEP
jgi:hypothetical protein